MNHPLDYTRLDATGRPHLCAIHGAPENCMDAEEAEAEAAGLRRAEERAASNEEYARRRERFLRREEEMR